MDVNSDAVAYAVLQYGMNTEDINAVRGKGNFKPVIPNGESSTGSGIGSGGGLHDDDHAPVTE